MKGIFFILSLYLVVLTLTPCSDYKYSDEIQKEHYSSGTHNHSNECPDDDCSPLCSCTCCHINLMLTLPYITNFQEFQECISETHDTYNDMSPKPYHEALFHPPIG